jgi:G:T-mismatch repair DNA endonuclease (very short patch repair protein)
MSWQSHVPKEDTLPERQCEALLKELGLSYDSQYQLDGYAEHAPILDFLVEGVLGVEVQGAFWHTKKSRVRKDVNKQTAVELRGLALLPLWDKHLRKAFGATTQAEWRPVVKDWILSYLTYARRVHQLFVQYQTSLPDPPLLLVPGIGAVSADELVNA